MKRFWIVLTIITILAFPAYADVSIGGGIIPGLTDASSVAITGGTMSGVYQTIPSVIVTDGKVLTASECSGTSLNNYGMAAAITATLPACAAGLNFIIDTSTQYNGAFKIQRAGSDTLIVNGEASKTYIQQTNQAIGSHAVCRAVRSGASSYVWVCTTVSGTWVTD